MDLIFFIAAFIGGCFAGGVINHWMVSSGLSTRLGNIEADIGHIASKISALKPVPAPVKPATPAATAGVKMAVKS